MSNREEERLNIILDTIVRGVPDLTKQDWLQIAFIALNEYMVDAPIQDSFHRSSMIHECLEEQLPDLNTKEWLLLAIAALDQYGVDEHTVKELELWEVG